MQLIVDAEKTIDLEYKMTTINQDPLSEKFSSNVIENFSNEISNDGENTSNFVNGLENSKAESENSVMDYEAVNIDLTTTNPKMAEPDNNKPEIQTLMHEFDGTSSPISNLEEKEGNANNDNIVNKSKELESHDGSAQDEQKNRNKTEMKNIMDDDLGFKPTLEDVISIDDVKSDDEDLTKKSKINYIENKEPPPLEPEIISLVDKLGKDKEQDKEKITNIDSQNFDEKNLDCKKPISCATNELCDQTDESTKEFSKKKIEDIDDLKDEDKISNYEDSKNEVVPESSDGNESQNNTILSSEENCNEDSVGEENKLNGQSLEMEVSNVVNGTNEVSDGKQSDESRQKSSEGMVDDEKIENEKVDGIQNEEGNKVKVNDKKLDDTKVEEKESSTSMLSNISKILDIFSDDEDEQSEGCSSIAQVENEKQCISLVDDDDVMLVGVDTGTMKDNIQEDKTLLELSESSKTSRTISPTSEDDEAVKDETVSEEIAVTMDKSKLNIEKNDENMDFNIKPLLPSDLLKTCKKNLADMTREDLEEFCSMKIVECVIDRSNLGDIKSQLKTMANTIEEFKKKTMMLTKQNRDLQVVLKFVQEEQKKASDHPITPLKITRSVGMQVVMTDKPIIKTKNSSGTNASVTPNSLCLDKPNRNTTKQKAQKNNNQQIPVPRLVPAANTGAKANTNIQTNKTNSGKSPQSNISLLNVKNSPPVQKPEKRLRPHSVTVDLTDDEPPAKMPSRSSPAPSVRLVSAQNLLPLQRPQFVQTMNSPRKVYIPISGPPTQNVRPGQAVMLKSGPGGPRQRVPGNNLAKMQSNSVPRNKLCLSRHPAPLPDAVKQYQPPNWKVLPPAPGLKLSKVENGIVISWYIDGYQENIHEDIISYQLFAYQECANHPPSTSLWKKIGDVKALPLPMACTLTQFVTGYKYYFAVRAVDAKSRFGPFSVPEHIRLTSKT